MYAEHMDCSRSENNPFIHNCAVSCIGSTLLFPKTLSLLTSSNFW